MWPGLSVERMFQNPLRALDPALHMMVGHQERSSMYIRKFRVGDESALHAVFHSAVDETANRDDTPEQLDAWASARQTDVLRQGSSAGGRGDLER